MSKWNFMNASGVYIYPSANASDGGVVNSEHNVSGISEHLIQKNFVIKDGFEREPFKVFVEGSDNEISVSDGSVIINGYYVNLTTPNQLLVNSEVIDSTYITDFQDFSNAWDTATDENNGYYFYNENTGHYELKNQYKSLTKQQREEQRIELPAIHFIIKLLKNATGNVRGDLYARSKDSTVLTCQGCAWSFVPSTELDSLEGTPYIDIATIIVVPDSNNNLTINEIINSPIKYAYIDVNSIYDDKEGKTFEDYLSDFINKQFTQKPKLTLYKTVTIDGIVYKQKELEFSLEQVDDNTTKVQVTRYVPATSGGFDDEGNIAVDVVEPSTNENATYSIDDIQARTHVADPDDTTTPIALVGDIPAVTNNGSSTLLARADHNHDPRYISNKGNSNVTNSQQIGTELDIDNVFKVRKIQDSNPIDIFTINNNTGNANLVGNLTVTQDIRANKVYNAVWNDIAELYKKEYPEEHYPEGTVICKVPNKDTYMSSDYSKRKLVIGVASESYGHLLGGDADKSLEENLKNYIPVSLAGRVPVKVEPYICISEGDLLVVSTWRGVATTTAYPEPGTIIGKALESTDGTKDTILMQVMLG